DRQARPSSGGERYSKALGIVPDLLQEGPFGLRNLEGIADRGTGHCIEQSGTITNAAGQGEGNDHAAIGITVIRTEGDTAAGGLETAKPTRRGGVADGASPTGPWREWDGAGRRRRGGAAARARCRALRIPGIAGDARVDGAGDGCQGKLGGGGSAK